MRQLQKESAAGAEDEVVDVREGSVGRGGQAGRDYNERRGETVRMFSMGRCGRMCRESEARTYVSRRRGEERTRRRGGGGRLTGCREGGRRASSGVGHPRVRLPLAGRVDAVTRAERDVPEAPAAAVLVLGDLLDLALLEDEHRERGVDRPERPPDESQPGGEGRRGGDREDGSSGQGRQVEARERRADGLGRGRRGGRLGEGGRGRPGRDGRGGIGRRRGEKRGALGLAGRARG